MRRLLLAIVALVLLFPAGAGAQRYDWRLQFRTIDTEHFSIHYHQGEEAIARRLAALSESIAARLARDYGRPAGRVDVILVDQTDLSNGWATPVPYNLIEIAAVPPPGLSVIGNTDDWLRTVFAHEYVHVLHLDRSRGVFGALRRLFGRSPVLFPNVFLPIWQIEGLATFEEGLDEPRGRVHAGEVRTMIALAAAQTGTATLDRSSHPLIRWPSGNAPYVNGALFHEYLARRFGRESLARLASETAGYVPYFGSLAFREVFGESLGSLWRAFEAELKGAATVRSAPGVRRITTHGFTVTAPRFAPDGRLFYSITTPHAFPALLEHGDPSRHIADRFLGDGLGAGRDWLIFDQIEYVRSVGLQSDLYAVPARGGRVRRLTRGARAADPDLSPDGRTVAYAVQHTDRRPLVTMPLGTDGEPGRPVVLLDEPGVSYYLPRWSPDGRRLLAEARRVGVPPQIVIVDVATRSVRSIPQVSDGRAVTPGWLNDDVVLFAAERERQPFAIYAVDLRDAAVRRLVAPSGAHGPVVSPDGRTLVFVGLSGSGYDLYEVALEAAVWDAARLDETGTRDGAQMVDSPLPAGAREHDYTPFAALRPRFWTPIVQRDEGVWSAGAATGGMDPLGRHAYGAAVTWSTGRARPDWAAAYLYERWRPGFFVQASDDTDPFRDGEWRTTAVDAGVQLPVRRVRWASSLFGGVHASEDTRTCASCDPSLVGTFTRRAVRGGWRISSARRYGYSISPVDGGTFVSAVEADARALGASGSARAFTADARWYVPVGPRHGVLAVRGAAAAAWGEQASRRVFSAGGSEPQGAGFDFGVDAIGLLRGYDEADVFGWRAAVINADYRVPLARIERGLGTVPLFVRTVHGAVFVDAGHAWLDRFRRSEVRRAYGAELSADLLAGYVLPLTVTGGAAWRDDPSDRVRGWALFARIGGAF